MTLSDVAEALKVSEKTVSRMLQDGSIPGFKVANQWRFYREDFYRWVDDKRSDWGGRTRAGLATMLSNEMETLPLSRLTDESLIVTGIPTVPVDSVLRILIEPLLAAGVVSDADAFLDGLKARESMMSTGVGGGVAIPHLRHPGDLPMERPRLVVGVSSRGVDWKAFDGQPVHILFLPLAGDEVLHLRMLAAIRRAIVVDGVNEALCRADTPRDVLREILKIETIQQSLGE